MALSTTGIRSWWPWSVVRAPEPDRGAVTKGSRSRDKGEQGSQATKARKGTKRRGEPQPDTADDGRPQPSQPDGREPAAASPPEEPEIAGRPPRTVRTYAREAAALLLLAAALYVGLALASYRADPLRPEVVGENWVGPVGEAFARFAVTLVGGVSWLIPLEIALIARPLLTDQGLRLTLRRVSGNVLLVVVLAALVHIALPQVVVFGAMPLGGSIGSLFGEVLRGLFSTVGSFLIGLTVVALILVERAAFSFIDIVQAVERWLLRSKLRLNAVLSRIGAAWSQAREKELRQRESECRPTEPRIASPEQADAIIAAFADDGEPFGAAVFAPPPKAGEVVSVSDTSAAAGAGEVLAGDEPAAPLLLELATEPEDDCSAVRPSAPTGRSSSRAIDQPLPEPAARVVDVADAETPSPSPPAPSGAGAASAGAGQGAARPAQPRPAQPRPAQPEDGASGRERRPPKEVTNEPRIVDTSAAQRTDKSAKDQATVASESTFQLPSTSLLNPAVNRSLEVQEERLRETAHKLEKTLADYGVQGRVEEIHPGPTVTTFEVSPAPGTKVSKVAGLADDLALGLSRKVRIVAPIPGKNRIGFEVPNESRVPVSLRELIEDRRFLEMKAPLPCVLGRDIIGTPFFADLSAMPHVIVAGATGAGKSVGLNVILVSLLYRRTPEELRLLMIDPKVVELAPFDHIPHLLFPVVTDMKQAANALRWAVDEMERRYQLFADAGTRNINTYNRWAERPEAERLKSARLRRGSAEPEVTDQPTKLPFIVVVVEEFADLMMQRGKDVETSVARLAQKARAAGIHVILATQRPSVDVITGMIKANFPTRIAFRVAQKVDSRTILDEQGAEHLLGRGDMLIKLNGSGEMKRVQCPFVSEQEVQDVTDMLRAQGEPDYDDSIVSGSDDEQQKDPEDAEGDSLYDRAVQIVAETQKCSTSWIQRKLGIGYNRAAKIVETMERNQVIGPANGSKPREIFVSPQ